MTAGSNWTQTKKPHSTGGGFVLVSLVTLNAGTLVRGSTPLYFNALACQRSEPIYCIRLHGG
jgi:hypothetical protein